MQKKSVLPFLVHSIQVAGIIYVDTMSLMWAGCSILRKFSRIFVCKKTLKAMPYLKNICAYNIKQTQQL